MDPRWWDAAAEASGDMMPTIHHFAPGRIASARAHFTATLDAYARRLPPDGPSRSPSAEDRSADWQFYNTMALVLDRLFARRARRPEARDAGALREVRLIADCLLENGGAMRYDGQLKPDASVLRIQPEEPIRLSRADIGRLADAYFHAVEKHYGTPR